LKLQIAGLKLQVGGSKLQIDDFKIRIARLKFGIHPSGLLGLGSGFHIPGLPRFTERWWSSFP
jgi:hypothetical protein